MARAGRRRWTPVALATAAGLAVVLSLAGGVRGQDRQSLVAEGRRLAGALGCLRCHTVGAAGTPIGPDLRGAGSRYREADLARWLVDPAAQEPTRHMPPLSVSPDEARALAAYLSSLP